MVSPLLPIIYITFSFLPGSILTSSSGNFSSIHSFEIISILAFGFLIFSSLFCYQKWRHRKYDVITINYIISLDFLSFRKLGLTCEKTSRESKYRRINWHCVWLANQKTLFTPTLIHPPDWESRKIFSKITLKPLMHTKTHKKRTIFLNRETIPYFIFSEIERQIFEGVGFGFFCWGESLW